jgi:hypothetical protein
MNLVIHHIPKIKSVEFVNSSIMFIHLDNDRTFLVPIDKFPDIKSLSVEQRTEFEIIDDTHLSFVAIDEIYSLEQLMGVD